MKVYVRELPKKCEDCPCCSGDQYCNYMWENYTDTEKPHFDECNLKDYCKVPYDFNNNMTKYKEWLDNLPKNNNEQYKTCPLQSLADYTKQVRKEVVEFIDKCMEIQDHSSIWINPDGTEFSADVGYVCEWWDEFKQKLLDQIQGENKSGN